MKRIYFSSLFSCLLLAATAARAETCVDLATCAKLMYDLKGQRYIFDAKAASENKFVGSPNLEMSAASADIVFTALLDQLGLARVPVGDGKTFRVVRSMQRPELGLPVLEASADHPPAFPSDTWDWVTMRYKVKSPEEAAYLESAYRSHVPHEGSVLSDENAGIVLVTAPTPVVRKMYDTLFTADRPLTTAMKAKVLARERLRLQARFGPAAAFPGKN
jgi:hypothetical protein